GGLREVFDEAHGRPARTFPSRRPLLPLDRIYVRNVKTRGSRVLASRPWSHLSDHAALITEVQL
ncbi:EEP domain-containing protein, partial [Uliginosibacterium sp. sgz301328]